MIVSDGEFEFEPTARLRRWQKQIAAPAAELQRQIARVAGVLQQSTGFQRILAAQQEQANRVAGVLQQSTGFQRILAAQQEQANRAAQAISAFGYAIAPQQQIKIEQGVAELQRNSTEHHEIRKFAKSDSLTYAVAVYVWVCTFCFIYAKSVENPQLAEFLQTAGLDPATVATAVAGMTMAICRQFDK